MNADYSVRWPPTFKAKPTDLRCVYIRLYVSIVCIKQGFHGTVFRVTSSWHPREDPRSILVRHVRHARFRRDLLATSSRGCHEDVTRKTVVVEFKLYRARAVCTMIHTYTVIETFINRPLHSVSYVYSESGLFLQVLWRRPSVCRSVCVLVMIVNPAKNGWGDQDFVWGGD